jgi:hypothetical protein
MADPPSFPRHPGQLSESDPSKSHDAARTALSNSRIKIRAAMREGSELVWIPL